MTGRVRENIGSKSSVRSSDSEQNIWHQKMLCSDKTYRYTMTVIFALEVFIHFSVLNYRLLLKFFNLKTSLFLVFSSESLHNLAIFVFAIIFKKMFCQNRMFSRTLMTGTFCHTSHTIHNHPEWWHCLALRKLRLLFLPWGYLRPLVVTWHQSTNWKKIKRKL